MREEDFTTFYICLLRGENLAPGYWPELSSKCVPRCEAVGLLEPVSLLPS